MLYEDFTKAQKKLVDSYIDLISNRETDKITVKTLVDHAGVTRSTFYANYNNIEDLYACIRDEFVRCARKYLLNIGRDAYLLQILIDWCGFCRKHAKEYVAMREVKNSDFAESITAVWAYHIQIMQNYDQVPPDGFRLIHEAYAPVTNEYIVYAWLKRRELQVLSASDLAHIINNQRLHYVTTALTRQASDFRYRNIGEYMTSEVVSVHRMRELLTVGKEDFVHRTFTDEEILQAEESYISLYYYAQFYAGKRAICRSIVGHIDSSLYLDISVTMVKSNTPVMTENTNVALAGRAQELAREKNINRIRLTTAAETEYVTAFVLSTL